MSRKFTRILIDLIEKEEIDISSLVQAKFSNQEIKNNLLNYPLKTLKIIKQHIPNIEEKFIKKNYNSAFTKYYKEDLKQ